MKEYLSFLLLPLIVFTISCEDEEEKDTSPPTVAITSPFSGSNISKSTNTNFVVQAQVEDDDEIDIVNIKSSTSSEILGSSETTQMLIMPPTYQIYAYPAVCQIGTQYIIVEAIDKAGNIGADSIQVTISE